MEDKKEWDAYAKIGVECSVPAAYLSCTGNGVSFYGKILIGCPSDVKEAVNDAVAIALSELNSELDKPHRVLELTKPWSLTECDDSPKTVELYPTPSEEEDSNDKS